MKDIKIVIGANFGDEGKGKLTDYYTKNADNCIVVCSNGGAQRGHTVLKSDGTRHVFHHFGSGTLNGADTYLPEDFILNPLVFKEEWEELKNLGWEPYVYVHGKCMITNPLDMMANQIMERSRGNDKHGSCGMGIYNTIQRYKKQIYTFTSSWSYYMNIFKSMGITLSEQEEELFNPFKNPGLQDHYNEDLDFMMSHVHVVNDDQLLNGYDTIVFENGQGLLLDQNNMEYFPHLTPSNTGIKNPARIIKAIRWTDEINIEACYVTRTYMTRHGAGAFPTECNKEEINPDIKDLTNVPNPHQDTLRYGKLNVEELYERCQADIISAGFPCQKTLAITHFKEYWEPVALIRETFKKSNWGFSIFHKEEN